MAPKRTRRFPLLPYRILARRWAGPAFWLIPAGVGLWWIATHTSDRLDSRYAPVALLISVAGLLIFAYTRLTRGAHVRCLKAHFTLRTPFYPIAFAYRRVTMVRPVAFGDIFPWAQEKPARRNLYRPLWGKTAVVVDLRGLPLPRWWMRLWVHPYLLHPHETSLVLVVEDWMGLSRALETHRTAWRERRRRR